MIDELYFFFGRRAWYDLVTDRGWAFDRAEAWLTEAACRTLLETQR